METGLEVCVYCKAPIATVLVDQTDWKRSLTRHKFWHERCILKQIAEENAKNEMG